MTAWIMTRPGRLADDDRASLDAILAAIMNERRGRKGSSCG